MKYNNFKAFTATQTQAILTVTFILPPVNIQGNEMITDLDNLAEQLEKDETVKVVIFESAKADFVVSHEEMNMLEHISTEPIERGEIKILELALVLERLNKVSPAVLNKVAEQINGHKIA
ncbi:hypothetical protein AN639_12125 [Candidatus Epulonipiscium fishelsonii]|uniref:Uncharacterized protein n=1 Tax=Candidatus Epulonipiscium fishelsonii TaxID=77094 RepID=A0ACC8X7F2_9FIRM|nr:hypothetical protein AN396_12565 [Epulopiscium sp. SCG-B11WGA-EpuloA1]ONI42674.1 hypothetical protein AN639_12125 [Epulopiscium sp. SCG-B05WGA-EpuloA1]